MNEALTQLLKIIPPYVLVWLVVLWVAVKTLPDATQTLGIFSSSKRRLTRLQTALEIIKVKIEVFQIAKDSNIKSSQTLESILKSEIELVLQGQNSETNGSTIKLSILSKSILAVILVTLSELIIFGILSTDPNFKWFNLLLVPFLISTIGAFTLGLMAFSFLEDINEGGFAISTVLLSFMNSICGAMVGLMFGIFLTDGTLKIFHFFNILTNMWIGLN